LLALSIAALLNKLNSAFWLNRSGAQAEELHAIPDGGGKA
jgi:hypothetical protein